MHVGSRWDAVWSDAQSVTWDYSVEDTFHIVSMVWTPNSIDMYMDRAKNPNPYFHADLEPNENADYDRSVIFGKPNFIIANLAVGGNFPGIFNINNVTALADGPRSVYIDWIRIWQRGDANESFSCPSASDEIEPENPQGVENVQGDEVQSTKVLREGAIYILRNGHIYNINGQQIQ